MLRSSFCQAPEMPAEGGGGKKEKHFQGTFCKSQRGRHAAHDVHLVAMLSWSGGSASSADVSALSTAATAAGSADGKLVPRLVANLHRAWLFSGSGEGIRAEWRGLTERP